MKKDYNEMFGKMTDEIVKSTEKALSEAESANWTRFGDRKPKKITVNGKEAILL